MADMADNQPSKKVVPSAKIDSAANMMEEKRKQVLGRSSTREDHLLETIDSSEDQPGTVTALAHAIGQAFKIDVDEVTKKASSKCEKGCQPNITIQQFITTASVSGEGHSVTNVGLMDGESTINVHSQTQDIAVEEDPDMLAVDSFHPVSNIPDPLPEDVFVGRQKELCDLRAGLEKGRCLVLSHSVAITAYGGTGKTSLALQYAHSHKAAYPGGLFWVVATANRLTSDYANLASVIDPESATKLTKAEDKIMFVNRELCRREGWLLILDNADEESAHNQLEKLLPARHQIRGGHIIITTRCSYVEGLKVAAKIELPTLTEEESIRFLVKRTGRDAGQIDSEAAVSQKIVRRFGGLPLLLEQAVSYMNKKRCSLEEYLKAVEIRGNLPLDGPSHGVDRCKRVENTFILNFDEMLPASRDIFNILGFCDPDEIPFEVFSVAWNSTSLSDEFVDGHEIQLKEALKGADVDRTKLLELLEPISRYSLVSLRGKSYAAKVNGLYGTIHREVQRQARERMQKDKYQDVLYTLTKMLAAVFQYSESGYPQLQKDLLPHARSCLSFLEKLESRSGHFYVVAQLLLGLARCESRLNLFEDAGDHFDKCNRLVIHQDPTEVTANLYFEMGRLARRQEDFGRAVALLQNAYRTSVKLDRKRTTASMSVATAEIAEELANTFIDNKKFSEAIGWLSRCEEAFQGDTASPYSKAHFYSTYGKAHAGLKAFGKAALMYEKAKELTQEEDYRFPIYNTCCADMIAKKMEGNNTYDVTELEKAREMCELSDRIIRDQSGTEHRYLAWNAGILAGILRHLPGQDDYAITKLEEAERIQRKAYGNKHEQLGNTLFEKGRILLHQGKREEGNQCLLQSQDMYRKGHPRLEQVATLLLQE